MAQRRTATTTDRKYLGRSEPATPIEIVAASGSRVRDARGRTFIDFQMGFCVGNLGWNPPEILARVHAHRGPSYVAPGLVYGPWTQLARELVAVAPGRLARAYRCVGGTEAVELALLLAMTHTGRHKIVSIADAYHGNSFAARSVGAHDGPASLPGMKQLAPPLDARALDRLATLLQHRDVAAVILEPVIMNLGVMIPDADFMRGLVALCHRHGTLVIADEVASGFGRTGTLFACERDGLEPDLVCLAKAITSGVAPLGATLATAEIARSAEGELEFYSTFGWHPLAVEAALATLAHWRDHGDDLFANIAVRSDELRARLAGMAFEHEPELRIAGLAIGLGVGDERYAEQIEKRCRDAGLLVTAEDDTVVLFPALNIDADTLHAGLDILADCV